MLLYETCSYIFRNEGDVTVEVKVESQSVEYFFGFSGMSGRISDIPAYLGGNMCRCMPGIDTRYIITI